MTQPPRRGRFIAGAVCPRCGLMDKILLDAETNARSCISCGFSEERAEQTSAAEPATRVSRAAARRIDTPAEPVKLIDTQDEKP